MGLTWVSRMDGQFKFKIFLVAHIHMVSSAYRKTKKTTIKVAFHIKEIIS